MPCNSEYMRQNDYEKRLQETAQLLVFAMRKLELAPTPLMISTANDQYADYDFTPELCKLINGLSEFEVDQIIYNGRDPMSRRLADWWERHQQADKERIKPIDDAIAAIEKALSFESIRLGFRTIMEYQGAVAARAFADQCFYGNRVKLSDVPVSDYPRLGNALVIRLRQIRNEEAA